MAIAQINTDLNPVGANPRVRPIRVLYISISVFFHHSSFIIGALVAIL